MASLETFTQAAVEYRAQRPAVRLKPADPAVEAAFAGNHLLFTLLWHIVEAAFAAMIAVECGDNATARESLRRLVNDVKCVARTWDRMHGPEGDA